MPLTVKIDKDRCIGSGNCVAEQPELFEFDASEQAVYRGSAGEISDERLRDVAWRCPTAAIRLYDENGDEVPPLA